MATHPPPVGWWNPIYQAAANNVDDIGRLLALRGGDLPIQDFRHLLSDRVRYAGMVSTHTQYRPIPEYTMHPTPPVPNGWSQHQGPPYGHKPAGFTTQAQNAPAGWTTDRGAVGRPPAPVPHHAPVTHTSRYAEQHHQGHTDDLGPASYNNLGYGAPLGVDNSAPLAHETAPPRPW